MIYSIHASKHAIAFTGKRSRSWGLISYCFILGWICLPVGTEFCQAQQTRNEMSESLAEAVPVDLNLRIVWGGEKPARYTGTIELDSGTLIGTQQLGIDAYDPSFILKNAAGKLVFDDASTRFGGCDIRVQSKSSSRLKLKLEVSDSISDQSVAKEFTWSLKSLRDTSDLQEIGLGNCRVSIDRTPGDRLRVVTQRNHLIYNSEEPLNLTIQPYGLPWSTTTANLECSLIRLDDEHQVFRKSKSMQVDGRGQGEPYDLPANAPQEEGVYELRFRIEPKRLLSGLLIRNPSIDRVVQFVVFNNIPGTRTAATRLQQKDYPNANWQPQCRIPSKAFDSQTLSDMLTSRIEGSKRFALFDFAKSLSILPKDSTADSELDGTTDRLSLPPGSITTATINGLAPGMMHRLSVLSANPRDTYRLSISPLGKRDSKTRSEVWANEVFDAPPTSSIEQVRNPTVPSKAERLEVLFWPNTRNAKLEITNLNATSVLGITAATVEVWKEKMAIVHSGENGDSKQRCILELHSANVRNAFGAESNSIPISPVYDDWQVYHRFASQLGQYCNANGFDTVAMLVHGQGGTLFPSAKLSSNARFDTGTFSTDGRDPIRKDVVELLFRALPRFGIEFVPLLELDSPIREVEESLARGDNRDLRQCRDGMDQAITNGMTLYNPLSSRVQQSIAIALEEFENRYRTHDNYRGYALRASPSTHLQVSLPIDQTNRIILDQFVGAVGGNLPKDTNQREQFISQRMQSTYSQWLQQSIHSFFAKLKAKPRWISYAQGRTSSPDEQSPMAISPVSISSNGMGFYEAQRTVLTDWNLGSPSPIHVSMEKPLNRFDSSFTRLPIIASRFQSEKVNSLPKRDMSRSLSMVRVWISKESVSSLLVSNAGAVTEWVHIVWDELPNSLQIFSSLVGEIDPSVDNSQIEYEFASKECRIQVAAGESIRLESNETSFSPISWYSQDSATVRTIDSALQSLEQAVTRLSLPQPRTSVLTNSSFEAQNYSARRGRLIGWTTSIDSNTLVETDSRLASKGTQSVKIEANNSSAIAWLQSDPFALTQSDRLFVSFQAASDHVPENATLSLCRFDANTERFEAIAFREFVDRVPRPSQQPTWGMVGVDLSWELRNTDQGDEPALYRLQFESKGIGRLWLDDISISTSFLKETERRDLRSELFLARTSLHNRDFGPAVTMLTSPRGRLVQWGDSLVQTPNVMLSNRNDKVESHSKSSHSSLFNGLVPHAVVSSDAKSSDVKAPDAKLRPIQRLRNSWWSRKE